MLHSIPWLFFNGGVMWMFPKIMVPPKSSILIGLSIINYPFWVFYPYFWKYQHVHNMFTLSTGPRREKKQKRWSRRYLGLTLCMDSTFAPGTISDFWPRDCCFFFIKKIITNVLIWEFGGSLVDGFTDCIIITSQTIFGRISFGTFSKHQASRSK